MIAHDPKLVILSSTIAILGAFTASVLTSNIVAHPGREGRIRLLMAALSIGGSLWAVNLVGLLAIQAPINLAYNPLLLAASAVVALSCCPAALYILWPKGTAIEARFLSAAVILGAGIAATNYCGILAIAGNELRLSWFQTLLCIAVSIETAFLSVWFLFRSRGVTVTLLGTIVVGLFLTVCHYAAVSSSIGLEETLIAIPRDTSGISVSFLAWAATIMMYLMCSICLSVFVIMQFRDEIR